MVLWIGLGTVFFLIIVALLVVGEAVLGRDSSGQKATYRKYKVCYNIRTKHPAVMMGKRKSGKIDSFKLTSKGNSKGVKELHKNPEKGNKNKAYFSPKITSHDDKAYRWFPRFRKWRISQKDRRCLNKIYKNKKRGAQTNKGPLARS